MKKIGILSVLIIIATAILFSGCLQKTESAPEATPQSTQEVQETKKTAFTQVVRGLTPRETVQSFWMALKEERYTDAKEYLDPSLIKGTEEALQQFYEYNGYGDRSIEEWMYNRFSRIPQIKQFERIERYTIEDYEKYLRNKYSAQPNKSYYDTSSYGVFPSKEEAIQAELEHFSEEYYSTEKIWSEKDKKPVEYKTLRLKCKLILKDKNGMIREEDDYYYSANLIKIDGVWKIRDSELLDY